MEEFLSFIADILEVDKNTLTLETSQDDVETWDSLMQLRLLGESEAPSSCCAMPRLSRMVAPGENTRTMVAPSAMAAA